MSEKIINKRGGGWLLDLAIIFFTILLLSGGAYLLFERRYDGKIYAGVEVGRLRLGGLTESEAKNLLDREAAKLNSDGIAIMYKEQKTVLAPTVSSGDAELAYDLFELRNEETAGTAYRLGRESGWLDNLQQKIIALLFGTKIPAAHNSNPVLIKKYLADGFSGLLAPSRDARLIYDEKNDLFSVEQEFTGETLNYDSALKRLDYNLGMFDFSPLRLDPETVLPRIRKNEVLNIDAEAKKYLALAPISLSVNSSSSEIFNKKIDKKSIAALLGLAINPEAKNQTDRIIIGLDRARAEKYLTEAVAPEVNRPASVARFEIKNGKVSIFQSKQNGLELDLPAALERLDEDLIKNKRTNIELPAKEIMSDGENPGNDLGIKEIIGVGKSNFAGSPKNRRHNIRTGANKLNGILIKPGEKFSLVATLGEIASSTGYLPELVIKGNKTTPEFGGGLCQIGTTMFRTALDSGLPILERRNHSYRVVYYEPAGTDATIYDPSPDLKFLNDTGNYILIQTHMAQNDLWFEFWGTGDGRVATRTKPVISNIVKPASAKIIETTDLKPGEKKCTEKAHNGADAFFDYTVAYPDGTTKEKRFSSHYIPWQEVCLLGVEKISNGAASSTPAAASSSKPTGSAL